ncbi:MAG: hypothetical protein JSS96_00395 [Bacteroidetes bacterium]|nr:hypothetical protein [Bacteroidota bacterium]
MYKFQIAQEKDGGWRFELDGITLLIDGFFIKDDKHWITNPKKAIAFFYIASNLYGVLNDIRTYTTAEELFDSMHEQYLILKGSRANISMNQQQNMQQENKSKRTA